MKVELVLKEMKSEACQEIVKELSRIIEKVQQKEIQYKQGMAEITGCKHIIQSIALDWTFNGKKEQIKKLGKQ